MNYRQTITNVAGLQADPTKPRYLHQIDGQCGISHQCKAVVVIDPDDRAQIERLMESFRDMSLSVHSCGALDCLQAALREFANPKPRIEEPTGLGAVVRDGRSTCWVRIYQHGECNDWRRTDDEPGSTEAAARAAWHELPRPLRILSPGYDGADS